MDTKIKVKSSSLTSTHEAVLLTIGSIGAFLVGVSMIFAMVRTINPYPKEPVLGATPMMIQDVTALNVGLDVYKAAPITWAVNLSGVNKLGGQVDFGTWSPVSQFNDGQRASTAVPVAVKVWSNNHSAALVTFQVGTYGTNGTPTCTDTDPTDDPNVKGTVSGESATAQLYSYQDSCGNFKYPDQLTQYKCVNDPNGDGKVPQAITSTCSKGCGDGICKKAIEDQKNVSSIFEVKEAHAATLETGTKYSICIPQIVSSNVVNQYFIYYADIDGNLYYDQNLTKRVSPIDCTTITQKTFAPNNISNITSNGTIDLGSYNGSNATLIFLKTIDRQLGYYNTSEGFRDFTYDAVGSTSPLMVVGMNYKDGTNTVAEQTLTVTSELGTTSLCFPKQTLDKYGKFAVYYDKNGNPYSDLFLTDKLDCGGSVQPVCTGAKTDPTSCFVMSTPKL